MYDQEYRHSIKFSYSGFGFGVAFFRRRFFYLPKQKQALQQLNTFRGLSNIKISLSNYNATKEEIYSLTAQTIF